MSWHDLVSAQNLYIWGFLLQDAQSTSLSHSKNAKQLLLIMHGAL